jgi:sulfate adenylyltransferase subunit 2
MLEFRDRYTAELGLKLIVWRNEEALADGANPIKLGTQRCCGYLKTQALLDGLRAHGFDAAFGGARRDEEKSRAKERIFSFRAPGHRWEPKAQRPELWNLYNTQINSGETIRVFPLSNWTEADVWQYIRQENIPIVPLYFAAERPVVKRFGQWIPVDDHRLPLEPGETPEIRKVRFRTLGCYPLTAGIESNATTLDEIVAETLGATTSERQGRIIDHDGAGSMERKKQEGYF